MTELGPYATMARHQVLEHLLLESQQLAVQDLPKQGRRQGTCGGFLKWGYPKNGEKGWFIWWKLRKLRCKWMIWGQKTWYHLRKPLCGLILQLMKIWRWFLFHLQRWSFFFQSGDQNGGRILGPKSDAKAAATGTNVPPWSLWFTVFANHSKTSFETKIARTPKDGRSEKRTHTHTLRIPLVSAIDMFIVKAGLDEMDNVVLRLEAQIRWGCLWMHTEQVDDWISGFAQKNCDLRWDPLTHCKILEMDLFPAKCWVWFRNNNPSQLETQPGMGEDVTCGDDLEWRCIGLISEWNLRHPFCLMSYVGLLADNAFYKAAKLGEWLMIEEPGFATSCKESRYPWNRRW